MLIIPFIEVVFPFMESLSFLFLDDFERNANISVTIKSGSTISKFNVTHDMYGAGRVYAYSEQGCVMRDTVLLLETADEETESGFI